MPETEQYWQILGLEMGASKAEVKQAYRDLVHVWHPDRFAQNPRLQNKAEGKLKEINAAYETVLAGFRPATAAAKSKKQPHFLLRAPAKPGWRSPVPPQTKSPADYLGPAKGGPPEPGECHGPLSFGDGLSTYEQKSGGPGDLPKGGQPGTRISSGPRGPGGGLQPPRQKPASFVGLPPGPVA